MMSNKLDKSITATNKSIIDLYNKIKSASLILRPTFQRKLVWRKNHKYNFIKTILDNYPFPEIYIATGEIDIDSMTETEVVVDGQQRLSTIRDYIDGVGDFEKQSTVPRFNLLDTDTKKDFLYYKVIVRELGNIDSEIINDVFQRINSTEYSLNTIEKMNASYHDNPFMEFCKKLLESCESNEDVELQDISCFFKEHLIFTDNDIRRMIDLQFIMLIVISLEMGYFNRTSEINKYLKKYNEDFHLGSQIQEQLHKIIHFINSLYLSPKSYWFNKANIFTLIIELSKIDLSNINIQIFQEKLQNLDEIYITKNDIDSKFASYMEVAKEAVNDKKSRILRGEFIQSILADCK